MLSRSLLMRGSRLLAAPPLASRTIPSRLTSLATPFSTTAAPNPAPAVSKLPKAAEDDNNLFLDNLGKIFGASLLALVVFIVRSSKRSSNKTAVQDEVEETTVLDPVEIEEMRSCNTEFTPILFSSLVAAAYSAFPSKLLTYPAFLSFTRTHLITSTADVTATIQLGHYLDRVMLSQPNYSDSTPYSLGFLFTILSLALYSSVAERQELLYTVLQHEANLQPTAPLPATTMEDFLQMLKDGCQLPPEVAAIECGDPYPFQNFKVVTGGELLNRLRDEQDTDKVAQSAALYGNCGEEVGMEVFRNVLKAKLVCAWGECYKGIRRRD